MQNNKSWEERRTILRDIGDNKACSCQVDEEANMSAVLLHTFKEVYRKQERGNLCFVQNAAKR